MKISGVRYAFLVLVTALLMPCALAQQPTPSTPPAPAAPQVQQPNSDSPQTQKAHPADASSAQQSAPSGPLKENSDIKKQQQTGTSDDRLFFTLPNFLTVETENVPPLTVGQKFKVVARGSFDYIQIPWYGFLAGISQAENSEPGYGQGAQGYGERYGAYAADGTIENFMVGAIFPSVLKQDPRYYQMGKGGFWHRTSYAVSRIFVTLSDSRHQQFNFSEIGGAAAASFISTYSYHPSGDRNVPNALSIWGSQVGYDTITLVVKEFWPDIRRKLTKKK